MNDLSIQALIGVITIIATAGAGWWSTRSKTDASLKMKKNDEDTELRREYIHGLKNEITRLLLEIGLKDEEIKKQDALLTEVTNKLHEMAILFTTKDIEYKQAMKELGTALTELDALKGRVHKAVESHEASRQPQP